MESKGRWDHARRLKNVDFALNADTRELFKITSMKIIQF
jgi:hypothetical protein